MTIRRLSHSSECCTALHFQPGNPFLFQNKNTQGNNLGERSSSSSEIVRLYFKQADKRFFFLENVVPSPSSNDRSQIKVVINII